MNQEINARMDALLKRVLLHLEMGLQMGSLDHRWSEFGETFLLKLKTISELMKAETTRVEQGGKPDEGARKTFARIFDRFSAQLLELGAPEDICEDFNRIANDIR